MKIFSLRAPTRLLIRIRRFAVAVLGSTAVALAAGPTHAEVVRLGGTGAALGTMKLLGEAYRKVDAQFTLEIVPNLGSTGGIRALERDAIHIAVAGRSVSKEEAAKGLVSVEHAKTPFVLATSRPNTNGLSLAQIAEIYSGRTSKWPDGLPVRLVLRPASDGDSALLASFSPAVKEALTHAMKREGMIFASTDQDSANEIVRLKGGFGTTSLALILSENRALTPLPIEGVMPSVKTLENGSYPYSKALHIVTREKPPESVTRFLSFVRSAEGRRILLETGHVVAR